VAGIADPSTGASSPGRTGRARDGGGVAGPVAGLAAVGTDVAADLRSAGAARRPGRFHSAAAVAAPSTIVITTRSAVGLRERMTALAQSNSKASGPLSRFSGPVGVSLPALAEKPRRFA
jgi:hypothetical protein